MKKLIALTVAILMLAGAMTVAVGAAEEAICVTSGLESVEPMVGSLVANDGGSVNMDGSQKTSLRINTHNATYGLNGNPEEPAKYNEAYNGSRRLKLTSFDDGKVLPAGTYTISLYVYENGNHLGAQLSHKSELAVSLHTADETDESLAYNHATTANLVKLFPADANDSANCFSKSGVEQKIGTRTWGQYTATITVDEAVSQFTFWIILEGDEGEGKTYSTWIDNLAIYNEAGDPTPKEEESSDVTEESQETPSKEQETTKAPSYGSTPSTDETKPAATEANTSATADEKGGCGASVGVGVICLLAVSAAGVVLKKKED